MRWWRGFVDKLSGGERGGPGQAPVGPRRREDPRYLFEVRLRAKCPSWPNLLELFTGDLSAGGMFIPTRVAAAVGERVELELELPHGGQLALRGQIVSRLAPEEAPGRGRRPGIGVKLDPMAGEELARFAQILATARAAAPTPEPGDPAGSDAVTAPRPAVPVPVPPEGSSPHRRPPASVVIGVDLGTTYTSVSALRGNRVTVLPLPDGSRQFPSVVSFPAPGTCLVGDPARDRLAVDPAHTVPAAKRLLGRQSSDRELEAHLALAPYQKSVGPDGQVLVEMWGETYAIAQLCSYLLADARKLAEKALGERVSRAVVTVPVSFDDERIQMVRRAGQLANLEIVDVIDEPSAAALANRFRPDFGGVVGVYDFGGGTFDFSVVDAARGDLKVLATAGDTWLGGDDFDLAVAEAVANQLWRMHGVDVRTRAVEWQQLLFACEQAKRQLSAGDTAVIFVPEILRTPAKNLDFRLRITRPPLERVWAPVIERSLGTCQEALALLGMAPRDLGSIYLSGGTTYIPAVRQALAARFGVPVKTGVPPEYAVCLGAGIHAAQLQQQRATTLRPVA